MKYAFLISIAMFAFAVSCGKKDKKQGQVGKPGATAATVCTDKNKETEECKKQAKAAADAAAAGALEGSPDRKETGSTDVKSELVTIPNTKDPDLKETGKMSIQINNQTSLIADLKISAQSENLVATKVICAEDNSKLDGIVEANPDELQAIAQIMLFNDSSIVADLRVNKGENKTDPTKLYMLTCKNKSTQKAADYKNDKANKAIEYREIAVGQQAFELVAMFNKKDKGVLTSFECVNDDQLLKDTVEKIGERASNRVRLRKGSAVMVFRAVDEKIGEKKLSELGTEAQKEKHIA